MNLVIGMVVTILLLIPFIPAKYTDPFGYDLSLKTNLPSKGFSIARIVIKSVIEIFFDLSQTIGLKGSATLLIF